MMKIQPTRPTGPFLQLDRNCCNMISWGIAGPSSRVTVFHPYYIVKHCRTMLSNPSTNIIYEICPQLSHEFDIVACGRGKVAIKQMAGEEGVMR